jgi:uncharacterized protein YkvS
MAQRQQPQPALTRNKLTGAIMKMKLKVGSVVQWRGRTWAVTKVNSRAAVVVLTSPEDMTTTAVAFRNEITVISTPRG